MQIKKVTFKKRLDAELRAFSPEDIEKSKTSRTSRHVSLPYLGTYNKVTGDWYLDKFTALMYLKYKYNKFKKDRPSGDDKKWFEAASKDFFDVFEQPYYEYKKKEKGLLSHGHKDEAVTFAEMIIYVNNYLEKIKDECGEIDYGKKFQSFSEKEGPQLSQLKILYKKWYRDVGGIPLDELTELSPDIETMAKFVGGAIGVAVVIWLISIAISSDGSSSNYSSSPSPTRSYDSINAICEPKLRRCVANNPESLWDNCRSNYSICLSN